MTSRIYMPPGGSPTAHHHNPAYTPPKLGVGGGQTGNLSLTAQLTQLHTPSTRNRNKPTIETPQILLAGLCPGRVHAPAPPAAADKMWPP